MGQHSKQKGAEFERAMSTLLSLWVTSGKRRDVFWRTAMSGGRSKAAKLAGRAGNTAQDGDVCSVSPEGHDLTEAFTIECKFYKQIDWAATIYGHDGDFGRFWRQAQRDADNASKRPLLIVKENRREELVAMSSDTFELLFGRVPKPDDLQLVLPQRQVGLVLLHNVLTIDFTQARERLHGLSRTRQRL